MLNRIFVVLLTIASLLVGGCTSTPITQNVQTPETASTSEIFVKDRIIYGGKGKFWAMDENGQNRQVIWNCPAQFECANISPDWKRGVYLEQSEQSWNVRLREREKEKGRILMVDVPQDKEFASEWSPNGVDLALLFYSVIEGEEKNNKLYIINIETDEINLIDTGISNTTWSPDGQYLVYRDFKSQGPGWYIADLDTGNRIQIIDSSLVQGYETWSPDSKRVALTISRPGSILLTSTFVKDLETGTLTRIQDLDQYNYHLATNPTWSPDGTKIAYIADYDTSQRNRHFRTLFIHDVVSGKQTALVEQVQRSRLIWSPYSQKIIYKSHNDGSYYLIDVDTKEITKILDEEAGYIVAWE